MRRVSRRRRGTAASSAARPATPRAATEATATSGPDPAVTAAARGPGDAYGGRGGNGGATVLLDKLDLPHIGLPGLGGWGHVTGTGTGTDGLPGAPGIAVS